MEDFAALPPLAFLVALSDLAVLPDWLPDAAFLLFSDLVWRASADFFPALEAAEADAFEESSAEGALAE